MAAALLAVVLAGCTADTPHPAPASQTPIVVRSPFDRNATALGLGPHLHDYWGGSGRHLVMDEDLQAVVGLALTDGATGVPVLRFLPPPGGVVPQGAASLEITPSWKDDPLDNYERPELWVKSAANREAVKVADIQSGAVVTMPTDNAANDLPHQVLSAWEFWVYAHAKNGALRFNALGHLKAEALRGLEIPVYPGHPDQWMGRQAIRLFFDNQSALYQGTADQPNICLSGCPILNVPANNTVVPTDAGHVEAWLNLTAPGYAFLGLMVHGADTRDFTALVPADESALGRHYYLTVGQSGDGPYARQSQWEFQTFIEKPAKEGLAREDYSLTAITYRV